MRQLSFLYHWSLLSLLTALNRSSNSIRVFLLHRYVPIIPMALVNGCKGIGTGFSTSILMYNPVELVQYIKCMLNGAQPPELQPWYRDFTGVIEKHPIEGKVLFITSLIMPVPYFSSAAGTVVVHLPRKNYSCEPHGSQHP